MAISKNFFELQIFEMNRQKLAGTLSSRFLKNREIQSLRLQQTQDFRSLLAYFRNWLGVVKRII